MSPSRLRVSHALLLFAGVGLGLVVAGGRSPQIRAGGADRSGETILTTGVVSVQYDEGSKIQVPQEALYYLDYKAGKLLATIPTFRQSSNSTTYLEPFAERDLVADFKVDLDNGPRPRFLMTTGQLGTFGGGWAPLFVFETTTGRVGVYRVQQQSVGARNQLRFDLLELRPIDPNPPAQNGPPGFPARP